MFTVVIIFNVYFLLITITITSMVWKTVTHKGYNEKIAWRVVKMVNDCDLANH